MNKEYCVSFRYHIVNKSALSFTITKICAVIEKQEFQLFLDQHNGSATFADVRVDDNASNEFRLAFFAPFLPSQALKLKIYTNKKVITKQLDLKQFRQDLQSSQLN